MLGNLHNPLLTIYCNSKGFFYIRQVSVLKLNIYYRARYLHDFSYFQDLCPSFCLFIFCALAPAVISVISWVIVAWRTQLYRRVKSANIFSAFLFAAFIAVIRALCSLEKLSTRAL